MDGKFSEHLCVPAGMEGLARQFHAEIFRELGSNPCQAMPSLYNTVR